MSPDRNQLPRLGIDRRPDNWIWVREKASDIKNGLEARSQTVHQEEDMHGVHKLIRGK